MSVVTHTIASLDARHGGPSRSVPALVDALRRQGVRADTHIWDSQKWCENKERTLIHDHGIWRFSNHRVARIARRTGLPRVVSVRGMLEPWALSHHRWRKKFAWSLYQRDDLQSAAVIHATSRAEAERIRRLGLTRPLAVIPNAVETPRDLPPRAILPRKRALLLSRIHPIKGIPMLIDAWSRVRPPDWELLIAGPDEGGHRAELVSLIRRKGLDQISFAGEVDDSEKWRLYRSAEIFVLPTLGENFGLVVAEALAAELPVITTIAAPWQDLELHRCGWWTEANTGGLEAALRLAVGLRDEERRAMGLRGRKLIEDKYSWRRAAAEMCDVYKWILECGDCPSCVF